MRRLAAQNEYVEVLLQDFQEWSESESFPSIDRSAYLMMSGKITRLQAEQIGSDPPTAAVEVNDLLVERFGHISAAFEFLSQIKSEIDNRLMNNADDELYAARLLGEQIVPNMSIFVETCSLAADSTIAMELDCLDVSTAKNSDWYKGLMGMMIYVWALESEAVEAIESSDASEARGIAMKMRKAANDMDNEVPPVAGQSLHEAMKNQILSIAALIDALAAGSNAEINSASADYDRATEQLTAAEAAFLRPCLTLGSNQD
jgi:hypothetical protein